MKINVSHMGWVVATVVVGVVAVTGFGAQGDKQGIVDLNKVIQTSALGKSNTAKLNAAVTARRGLVEFVRTYKVLTADQARTIRDLTLKENITDQEKQQLEKTKQDVIASDKRRSDLMQKGANLTEDEKRVLSEFAQRAQMMGDMLEEWNGDFNAQLTQIQQDLQNQTIDRAKLALGEVAKAQSFTLVFETNVAPYAANDLTDAVVKQMDSKR
ncbi:MAG TPA: OmpH family outer membrane protein [Fimbriimonadaceae bacterium]|nr:OmpH family outer membrane protein [Fimbriimonadaceae bacterium]